MNKKDHSELVGKKFGKWTVIRYMPERNKKGCHYYWCRCECGRETHVNKYSMKAGGTKECGKCKVPFEDLSGKVFGKLTAIKPCPIPKYKKKQKHWECRCQCGKILEIDIHALKAGKRTRCRKCAFEDLTGQRFGNQVVISRDYKRNKWLVRCDCGVEKFKSSGVIKITKSCGRCESIYKIGKKIGRLTLKRIIGYSEDGNAIGEYECDCGNVINRPVGSVSNTGLRSCGCLRNINQLEKARKMIGKKIGIMTLKKVVGYLPNTHRIIFEAKCACGNKKIILRQRLDGAKSCGCLLKDRPTGEDHHNSKLSNIEAQTCRELLKSGSCYTVPQIAKMMGIKESVVYNIAQGKTYKIEDK